MNNISTLAEEIPSEEISLLKTQDISNAHQSRQFYFLQRVATYNEFYLAALLLHIQGNSSIMYHITKWLLYVQHLPLFYVVFK